MTELKNGRNMMLGVLSSLLVGLILLILGWGQLRFAEVKTECSDLRTDNKVQDNVISDIRVSLSRVESDVSWIRKKMEKE